MFFNITKNRRRNESKIIIICRSKYILIHEMGIYSNFGPILFLLSETRKIKRNLFLFLSFFLSLLSESISRLDLVFINISIFQWKKSFFFSLKINEYNITSLIIKEFLKIFILIHLFLCIYERDIVQKINHLEIYFNGLLIFKSPKHIFVI